LYTTYAGVVLLWTFASFLWYVAASRWFWFEASKAISATPLTLKDNNRHGVSQTYHEDKFARLSAQHEQALTQLTEQHQQLMTHQLGHYEQARLEWLAEHQAECSSLKAQAQESREQLVAQQAQHAAEVDCLTKQQQGCTADLHLQLQTALQVRQASGDLYQKPIHYVIPCLPFHSYHVFCLEKTQASWMGRSHKSAAVVCGCDVSCTVLCYYVGMQ
jgi:hypothetical protein